MDIRTTDTYDRWEASLRDLRATVIIASRIRRLQHGNPGDVKSVGDGVCEMRIHYGPGYRVYYTRRGLEIIVLLAGGDKSTQTRDIELAKRLAQEI